jgi:transcriptional regulator with XRE-family HTH domain
MSRPQQCHCCNGSGVEKNHKTLGQSMRNSRIKAGLSLRKMAKKIGISFSFLAQLERGNRHWTQDVEYKFLKALEEK